MEIRCCWEHNGNDSLLYAVDFPGAYTRGETPEAALAKMPGEIRSYLRWAGESLPESMEPVIVQEKISDLQIRDADSDVILDSEREPLTRQEYDRLKALALKSAEDFHRLYEAVPCKDRSVRQPRQTFYGAVPRTAEEMYRHTKSVNSYYFGELDVPADSDGTIASCRMRGFEALEKIPDFLTRPACEGSYGEEWSLRKLLRRFIWHDRIHGKALYRMALETFGPDTAADVFCLEQKEKREYHGLDEKTP